MNIVKQRFYTLLRVALVICFTSGMYGCSSSSSSTSNAVSEEQVDGLDVSSADATTAIPPAEPDSTASVEDSVANNSDSQAGSTSNDADDTADSTADAILEQQAEQGSDGSTSDENVDLPDPMIQNNTSVTFEVTVPAYQSNELQIQLNWGDSSLSLNWVGDEFWTVDANLPTNTERLLSVVFFDENGGIELGSFEQQYTTGSNAAEMFQINADQFDTSQWDVDEDGISNLDELIAGTDPRVDEANMLPIVDEQRMSLVFIANYFEDDLSTERPYMGTEDNTLYDGNVGSIVTADIDANGNGSIDINTTPGWRRNIRNGERLVLENSVQWNGTWGFSDDYSLTQNFDSEVIVDGDTRRLVESGRGSWVGTYDHGWQTTVDVTGQLVEGTAFCEVTSGAITEIYSTNDNGGVRTELTITRDSVDSFWRVSRMSEIDDVNSTSEYFARELSMHMVRFGYQRKVSDNDYFVCDFSDL